MHDCCRHQRRRYLERTLSDSGSSHPYQQERERLAEIDAPESGQPFGRKSKENPSALCFKAEATIRQTAKDRWGRTVARVECRDGDASMVQAQSGMAWAFTKYQTDAAFPRAKLAARRAGVGLWADQNPVAPWDFRRKPQPLMADANGCITGPKGGRYRLTPEGRKKYGC